MYRSVVLVPIAYFCNLSRVQKTKLGAFVFHELLFKFHLRVLKRYLRILYVFCYEHYILFVLAAVGGKISPVQLNFRWNAVLLF